MAQETEESIRTKLAERIRRELGHPILEVKLTSDHLQDAIDDAIEELTTYYQDVGVGNLTVSTTSKQYDLPAEVDEVVEVQTPTEFPSDLGSVGFEGLTTIDELTGVGLDNLQLSLQYIEMSERLLSAEFDWDYIDGKLYVDNLGEHVTEIVYFYTKQLSLEDLPTSKFRWIREFATAAAREKLAEIRGKYSQVPTPEGGVQLNAQELNRKAQDAKKRLRDEARGFRRQEVPIVG